MTGLLFDHIKNSITYLKKEKREEKAEKMAPLQPESLFCKLDTAPADEVFALMGDFAADTHPDKVSLGAGVYRDNEAKSWRLPAVKKAGYHSFLE